MVLFFLRFIVVTAAGILIIKGVYSSGGFEFPDKGGGWFYHYQTIVSGVFALIAAAGTIFIMRHNHKDLLYRKNLATRAYMHDNASDVCAYSLKMFSYFWNVYEGHKTGDPPSRPTQSINKLKDNIGYIDKKSAKWISKLLLEYQVFHTHLNTKNRDKKRACVERIVDLIKIYALTERIFDYARNEKTPHIDINELNFDYMLSRYRVFESEHFGMGITYSRPVDLYNDIEEEIKRRFKSESL